MKKNETKKSTKEYINMLSPSFKRKKITFSQDLFRDLETNKIPLSQKRSQNKLLLNQQKVVAHQNHRRNKSNSENYPENLANGENNIGTNPTISQMSFFTKNKQKEKEKYVEYRTYIKNSVSRNLKSSNNNIKQYIQCDNDNVLSFSCSLKDFRNFIINSCSSKNNLNLPKNNHNNIKYFYNKDIKLKNNKSIFSTDYISNIEETNNTTSINNNNNINSNNLIYSKQIINEKGSQKKYIKINRKHSRKLYSSMDNNLKINYTNANNTKNNEETKEKEKEKEKASPKFNLHHFIYNHSNLKTKTNSQNTNTNCSSKINKYNNNINQNILSVPKKSLRNSEKYFPRNKKNKQLSIINPVGESYYDMPCTYYRSDNEYNNDMPTSMVSPKKSKFFNKNNFFPSTTTNQNKCKIKNIFTFSKNKLGRQNSQENQCNLKQNENGPMSTIKEFNSVEEIHFMFVQINQSKKQFFEKYEKIKK